MASEITVAILLTVKWHTTTSRALIKGNIYVVLNQIKTACYGRAQRDTLIQNPKSTTSDSDILARKWVLIDIDPKRPSDCNASSEELEAAKGSNVKDICLS